MAIEVVDLPIKKMWIIPVRYISSFTRPGNNYG